MPEQKTINKAKADKRAGKSASTQAGAFVKEEFDHIREGKHGAKSAKQAIAIGLSKARRAGVPLKPPAKGKVSEKSRKSAQTAYEKGQSGAPISKTRSAARTKALKKEPTSSASHLAISRQVRAAAKKRTPEERSEAAKKAVQTKRATTPSGAAKKASVTRQLTTLRTTSKVGTKTAAKPTTTTKRATSVKGPAKHSTTAKRRSEPKEQEDKGWGIWRIFSSDQ